MDILPSWKGQARKRRMPNPGRFIRGMLFRFRPGRRGSGLWSNPAITDPTWTTLLDLPFPQIATADLNISVIGQLPSTHLSFGYEFESRPMKVVRFEATSGVGASGSRIWKTGLETLTTPSYSPTPTPNSTTPRSGFQRASGGKRKNCISRGVARWCGRECLVYCAG